MPELAEINAKKKDEFGELLSGYLSQILRTLQLQADVVSDKEWLKKQPADALAILHGVLADKAIRLLEAAERIKEVTEESEEGSSS
jgi:hypothetical protein